LQIKNEGLSIMFTRNILQQVRWVKIRSLIRQTLLSLFFISTQLSFSTLSYAGLFEDGLTALGEAKYEKAYAIWRPLAENGNSAAQYYLGVMYANGQGIKKDRVLAYAWFATAAEEQEMAEGNRDDIKKKLSVAQLKRAKKLARDFTRKYLAAWRQ